MIIFPAIDIKEGKVVRLLQGRFDKVTEYSKDPVAMAKHWQDEGAQWLHVVDLDGAKDGEIKNLDMILDIAQSVSIPVQMGGGVRRKEDIQKLLEGGIQRIILGTKVIEDRNFLKDILRLWRSRIAVSLDCAQGLVAQKGWTATSELKAVAFARELETLGLTCLIYTDISKDGMLAGPHFEGIKELLENIHIPLIASGGVSSLEDIKKLSQMEPDGLIGAITGKALYDGKMDLKEAIRVAGRS